MGYLRPGAGLSIGLPIKQSVAQRHDCHSRESGNPGRQRKTYLSTLEPNSTLFLRMKYPSHSDTLLLLTPDSLGTA